MPADDCSGEHHAKGVGGDGVVQVRKEKMGQLADDDIAAVEYGQHRRWVHDRPIWRNNGIWRRSKT